MLDNADDGTYDLDEMRIENLDEKTAAEYRNKFLGFIFQSFNLINYKSALEYQDKLLPLHRAAFAEPSPAPTKYALSLLSKCENEVRAPLCTISTETESQIKSAMHTAGLISASDE